MNKSHPKPRLAALLTVCALVAVPAFAQGVRSLGMGGVTAPGGAAGPNPAYAALPAEETFVPLPLGLLNALVSDRFDFEGERFDLLAVFDQATHLDTFLFNPALSPDEVIIRVGGAQGVPEVAVETIGGARLPITRGTALAYHQQLELPIRFDVGLVGVGLRPYLSVGGRLTPDVDLARVFGEGTSRGGLEATVNGEAGVSVEVLYATAVPLPATDDFAGEVYLGVRAAPFIGLAHADAVGRATLAAVEGAGGEVGFEYGYEGKAFLSLVTEGGLGYGLRGDVGVATIYPTAQGVVTAGLALQDFGVAFWRGSEYDITSDGEGQRQETEPRAATRTYFGRELGVLATAAIDLDLAALGVTEIDSLLVAADGAYRAGSFSAHVGTEAGLGLEFGDLLLRAGLGYDHGLVAGVGTGLRFPGFGIDAALHSQRSPLTAHQAFGVSAGLSFGF